MATFLARLKAAWAAFKDTGTRSAGPLEIVSLKRNPDNLSWSEHIHRLCHFYCKDDGFYEDDKRLCKPFMCKGEPGDHDALKVSVRADLGYTGSLLFYLNSRNLRDNLKNLLCVRDDEAMDRIMLYLEWQLAFLKTQQVQDQIG